MSEKLSFENVREAAQRERKEIYKNELKNLDRQLTEREVLKAELDTLNSLTHLTKEERTRIKELESKLQPEISE